MAEKGTRAKTIQVFRSILGLTESPPGSNCNKITEWGGMGCVPWCALAVSWVFERAGVAVPRFAYTPYGADWFKSQGTGFTDDTKARRGDVVFFDFPDSVRRIQHVGIVLGNDGGRLTTIEANTSSAQSGSQDDGGGVFQRTRGYPEAVYFGRPPYQDSSPELPRFDYPKSKTWFGFGDTGADVKTWQLDLNRWMRYLRNHSKKLQFDFGALKPDGVFGPDTTRATKTFQSFYKLDVDGRVGAHTIRRMDRVRERQKAA